VAFGTRVGQGHPLRVFDAEFLRCSATPTFGFARVDPFQHMRNHRLHGRAQSDAAFFDTKGYIARIWRRGGAGRAQPLEALHPFCASEERAPSGPSTPQGITWRPNSDVAVRASIRLETSHEFRDSRGAVFLSVTAFFALRRDGRGNLRKGPRAGKQTVPRACAPLKNGR